QTDAEGNYSMRLPGGASMLYLMSVPEGYVDPPQKSAQHTVTIARGEAKHDGPVYKLAPQTQPTEAPGVATIRGRVVDPAGKPVKGVHIGDSRVERSGGDDMPVSDPYATTSGDDGRFHFRV